MDEDILGFVAVSGHQVVRPGAKTDIPAVIGDGRYCAHIVSLFSPVVNADSFSLTGLQVVNENVGCAVGVSAHQVTGIRFKGDIPAVAGDGGAQAVAVALLTAGINADPSGLPGINIVDENIGFAVGISCNKVGGLGDKGDISAVVGDGREGAGVVALQAAGSNTDPGGISSLPVAKENIIGIVGVSHHQVASARDKGHIPAVVGNGNCVLAVADNFDTVRVNTYPASYPGSGMGSR